ncbi:hypothetical protein GGI15_001863 [Coemansia interrupta]|uniref:BHLH domain-containing protein n=1 Tax=Coemansia interrupta TaxID=1126814 RepID=A0A9W8HJR4_9FUNG|nr:hypothetical protein GGI15_001863 [Coemansia interrupta]
MNNQNATYNPSECTSQADQLSGEWVHSFMSQMPITSFSAMPQPVGIRSITELSGGSIDISKPPMVHTTVASSDSESDEFNSISMVSTEQKPRRGRPALGSKRSVSTGKYLKPIKPTNQQHPTLLQANPITDPLLGDAAALSDTTSSMLIPHRVDRQLAAAARPLLFVRPTDINDKPRRRKRRCISKDTPLSADPAATPASSDEALAVTLTETDKDAADNHNSVQWQRISEQRRRDAMRESFDLLKRMLPQSYMTSDDGRELARPVLLARFLRWVDDTLIEMEGLKAEVARLRIGTCESSNQQQ